MSEANSVLSMKGITKRFPGIVANNKVDLELNRGEILALLGENGAGKSTLMSILAGLYQPDEGEIYLNGKQVHINSPGKAIELGIGMVHQHFMLVDTHSVTQNIVLGLKNLPFIPDLTRLDKEITKLSEEYGLPVDAKARIWQLSVGEQQRVEILKVLYRGANILILDEPTAVLTPQETKEFFITLKSMVSKGHSIIFISHKLDEVLSISNRITVLRGGSLVKTVLTENTNKNDLASLMVGRELVTIIDKPPRSKDSPVILDIKGLRAFNDKNIEALKGLSLTISQGEIMGLAGVAGNGQNELADTLFGLRNISGGEIFLKGENVTGLNTKGLIEEGVSYIPADRLGVGLVPNLDISDNAILKSYNKFPLCRGFFLQRPVIKELTEKMIRDYDIKIPDKSAPVRLLSGGNLQKLLLARELLGEPLLIIAVYPARGLDIGATEFVHSVLLEQRKRGASILLISEDLDEIFSLSDRISVIYNGRIMGIIDSEKADKETIGLMMAGTELAGVKNENKL